MSKQAGNQKVEAVVAPTTGEKQDIAVRDLWNGVEKVVAARNEKTYVPLTLENNDTVQDWLSLAIYPARVLGDAASFNVNPANE